MISLGPPTEHHYNPETKTYTAKWVGADGEIATEIFGWLPKNPTPVEITEKRPSQ